MIRLKTFRYALSLTMLGLLIATGSIAHGPGEGQKGRVEASGSFLPLGFPLRPTMEFEAGKSCVVDLTQSHEISGTLSGDLEIEFRILSAGPCGSPRGTFDEEWIAHGSFTGTVGGLHVTSNFSYVGKVKDGGKVEGNIVLGDGLEGELRVSGDLRDRSLSYRGWIQ